jgi:hypothetical protein
MEMGICVMAKLGNNDSLTLEEKQALIKTQALIHAESFYHYKLIARASGITDETLKTYRDEDEQFSHELEQARTRFLNKNMKNAKPEFLLERLEPELFKQRTEQDLNHNGEVSFVNDVPRPKKD